MPGAVGPNDLTDALIDKLGAVSEAWTETFPPTSQGYSRLQTAINRYGYPTVRSALQYALEERITPNGPNAMPLLIGLCKAREPKS